MVRIPSFDRQITPDLPPVARIQADTSVAQSLEGLGSDLGQVAAKFQERQDKQNNFDDDIRYQQHQQDTEAAFKEAQQNMPVGATGFAKGFIDSRKQADENWLGTISPANRQHYAEQWGLDQSKIADAASGVEYKARGAFETDALGKSLDTSMSRIAADPASTDGAIATLNQQTDLASSLSPVQKDAIKKNIQTSLKTTQFQTLYGKDPAAARQQLGIPDPNAAAGGGKPSENMQAASELPPEASRLLNAIASTESPGYNVINGGGTFSSYADHPKAGQHGSSGIAAGRYQFLPSTWDRAKNALGLKDFSPANQDRAAWWLAQQDYKSNTGRDLQADMQAGNYGAVRQGLSSTWKGLSDSAAKFDHTITNGQGPTPAGSTPVTIGGNPEWASIPYDTRLKLVDGATNFQKQQQEAQTKADNQAAWQAKGTINLGIQTGEIRSPEVILSNPNLRDQDKADLLGTLRTRTKDENDLSAAQARYTAGGQFNPFVDADRKQVDAVYQSLGGSAGLMQGDKDAALRLQQVVSRTGIVPKDAANQMQMAINSNNPAQAAAGLAVAADLYGHNPDIFKGVDGGDDIAKSAATFAHLTTDLGMSGTDAANKIIAANSPEGKRTAEQVKPEAEKFAKDLQVSDITNAFDQHPWIPFAGNVSAGPSPNVVNSMMADYREFALDEYQQAQDPVVAKARALSRVQALYGVSNVTGSPTLMKYPPERYYPPVDGSTAYLHDTALKDAAADALASKHISLPATTSMDILMAPIGDQARQDAVHLAIAKKQIAGVWLVPGPGTAADIKNGSPTPRYNLFYQTVENGQAITHQVLHGGFQVSPDDIAKMKAGVDQQHAEQRAFATKLSEGVNKNVGGSGSVFADTLNAEPSAAPPQQSPWPVPAPPAANDAVDPEISQLKSRLNAAQMKALELAGPAIATGDKTAIGKLKKMGIPEELLPR